MLVSGALAMTAALLWALRPVSIPALEHLNSGLAGKEAAPDSQSERLADRAIDLAAFDVDLWHAPEPPPVAAVESEPPQPPPNLELIAIVTEDSRCLAALYDADSHRMHMVGVGESIGSLEIIAVDAGGVELRGPSRRFRLTLRTLASLPTESIEAMLLARQEESEP